MAQDLITQLYNAFDPFVPLPAGDSQYVDCREARGDEDILQDLGRKIVRSNVKTCSLYSGHRGAGKSTELKRLKQYLEENDFYVIYFAADEQDIQSEDTQYTDILLACTRHLLEELNKSANPDTLLQWVKKRLTELKDIASMDISLEGLNVQAQIIEVAKLTANLRAEPTLRHQIRAKVNPHTQSLINILNDFIGEAKKKLPNNKQKLAIIVDNLDRIVPVIQESDRTNHEEIFIDRSEQLKALDCHLIYTVPISLLHSDQAVELNDKYSDTPSLPMLMVRNPSGEINPLGLAKLKELIKNRVCQFNPNLSLETELFAHEEYLEQICLMTGGHLRDLMHLMQNVLGMADKLPLDKMTTRKSISKLRNVYRKTVNNQQWDLLAEVYNSKRIINDKKYRELSFNRCLLEYHYWDEEGELQIWYDVHPLIRGIVEFKDAISKLNEKLNQK